MAYKENDIILVNPTGGWKSDVDGYYFFPIGLLYLRNYLLKHRIPSSIIDISRERLSPEDFMNKIRDLNPRIVGFTGSPFERHTLHKYIKGIKEQVPQALIVGGGPYFTATAKDCLEQLPEVDVVVRGEGEKTFLELVRAFDQKEDFNNLKGITFRNSNGEVVEKENNAPCNRDDCEIDLDLIPNDDAYSPFVYLKNFTEEKVKALPILLARGCTMKCTFCFNNNSGRFLSRTTGSVIEEIKAKRERFNCDYFWFVDPTFTLRERFAIKLCRELKAQCPGIKWYCETRADCSPQLIEAMAEAGCVSIDVALESGSPKVVKRIQKDLDPRLLFPFTKKCKELGIRVLVFVMYGLPEETYGEFRKTAAVLKQIRPHIYTISYNETLILPGTRMEAEARAEGIIPEGFSWYDTSFAEIPKWKPVMTPRQMAKARRQLYKYHYLLHNSLPGYWRRAPKLMVLSFWQRSTKIKKFITHFPLLRRFVRAASDTILGKKSL